MDLDKKHLLSEFLQKPEKPLGLAKTVDITRKIHTVVNMSLMFFLFIARLLASAALLHQSICLRMDVESLLS